MLTDHFQTIKVSRRNRVVTLTMDRPAQLNAVDAVLHEELSRVFRDANRDPESDVIVLTGAGRAFSAGGDMTWMQDAIDHPALFETTVSEAKEIVFSLLDCEKPTIAKINGPAVGLGATLALLCDVSFAADTTYIADPHVTIGMVAGDGGAVIWPQLIGYARAKELLFTGDRISSSRAAEIGLINHAVPHDELTTAVDAFADRLAAAPVKALRWTKVTINIALKQLAASMMDTGLAYEAITNISADHQAQVQKFRQAAAERAPR